MADAIPTAAILAASLCYGLLSALIPMVNAELYIAGATAVVPRPHRLAMVIAFTAATMVGKTALYVLADRLVRTRPAAAQAQVGRWVEQLRRRQALVWPAVFASALVGMPPLYPVTLAAGVLRIGVVGFFVVGCVGRFLRFSAITWAASGWMASWR